MSDFVYTTSVESAEVKHFHEHRDFWPGFALGILTGFVGLGVFTILIFIFQKG